MEEIIFCHNLLYESGNTEKPYQKRNIIIFDRFNLFLFQINIFYFAYCILYNVYHVPLTTLKKSYRFIGLVYTVMKI